MFLRVLAAPYDLRVRLFVGQRSHRGEEAEEMTVSHGDETRNPGEALTLKDRVKTRLKPTINRTSLAVSFEYLFRSVVHN